MSVYDALKEQAVLTTFRSLADSFFDLLVGMGGYSWLLVLDEGCGFE